METEGFSWFFGNPFQNRARPATTSEICLRYWRTAYAQIQFGSSGSRHWIVNTYFRFGEYICIYVYACTIIESMGILFGPGGPCQNPQPRSEAKIPYRGLRLVGTWLNWRSLPGIRFTIQRIEFLSQLSTPPRSLIPLFRSFVYRIHLRGFVSNPPRSKRSCGLFRRRE